MKKFMLFLTVVFFTAMSIAGDAYSQECSFKDIDGVQWAVEQIVELNKKGIINGTSPDTFSPRLNITRADFAVVMSRVFSIDAEFSENFADVNPGTYYYGAVGSLKKLGLVNGLDGENFEPLSIITRQDMFTLTYRIMNYFGVSNGDFDAKPGAGMYDEIGKFGDSGEISDYAKVAIFNMIQDGLIKGNDDNMVYPRSYATRVEVAVFAHRIHSQLSNKPEPLPSSRPSPTPLPTSKPSDGSTLPSASSSPTPVPTPGFGTQIPDVTPGPSLSPGNQPLPTAVPSQNTRVLIKGKSVVTLDEAKIWAKSNGAGDNFVNIADFYWQLGEITGIRADVLYAQSAKETNFGRYTGKVTPEMNNWAGIKIAGSSADNREDHETFETPYDGVRAHFNHMTVYVGGTPVGTPHGRYFKTITSSWAGTVKYVDELGGKWAPDSNYGRSIVENYLSKMSGGRQLNPDFAPADKNTNKKDGVKIVYLSPSNQPFNLYAAGGTNECEQMYLIAELVKERLSLYSDLEVYITPKTSQTGYLRARTEEAENIGADVYVSIHSNAANKKIVGTEAYYNPKNLSSIELTRMIYNAVDAVTPTMGRGIKDGVKSGLAELKYPAMPACLVEVEFHDVVTQATWIINNRQVLADAIAGAIAEYFGL